MNIGWALLQIGFVENFYVEKFKYSLTRIFPSEYIECMEKILSALAEHNRLKIIELLREQHLTVGEIAEQLDLRQPQVSKHLKVLSEAGLVAVFPVGNKRIYQLRGEPFKQLDRWLASYRDIQDARFDRLDAYLKELQRNDKDHGSEQ